MASTNRRRSRHPFANNTRFERIQHRSYNSGRQTLTVFEEAEGADISHLTVQLPANCPHANLSRAEIADLKLRNRRVCAVRGLPSFITDSMLRRNAWYGQFAGITNIDICGKSPRHVDSVKAFISFDNEDSAQQAIEFSNYAQFADGRTLFAECGVVNYCRNWLAMKKCPTYCRYRYKHEWARPEDVIDAHEVHQFGAKTKECGLLWSQFYEEYVPLDTRMTDGALNENEEQKLGTEDEFEEEYDIDGTTDEDGVSKSETKGKYTSLIVEYEAMKQRLTALTEDYKEMEVNAPDFVHNIYTRLQLACDALTSPCSKPHETWSTQQVVEWMVNLDALRYANYEKSLLANMKKEEIDGSCLAQLNKADLHRLGIVKFKDKTDIALSIQQLIESQ